MPILSQRLNNAKQEPEQLLFFYDFSQGRLSIKFLYKILSALNYSTKKVDHLKK